MTNQFTNLNQRYQIEYLDKTGDWHPFAWTDHKERATYLAKKWTAKYQLKDTRIVDREIGS